jgi:Fe-S oxidoreductase
LNEGEGSTKKILESIVNGDKIERLYSSTRLVTLEDMPSCYTDTDIMEKIITENDSKWSSTLETNRGCPFKCTFLRLGKSHTFKS